MVGGRGWTPQSGRGPRAAGFHPAETEQYAKSASELSMRRFVCLKKCTFTNEIVALPSVKYSTEIRQYQLHFNIDFPHFHHFKRYTFPKGGGLPANAVSPGRRPALPVLRCFVCSPNGILREPPVRRSGIDTHFLRPRPLTSKRRKTESWRNASCRCA